MEGRAVFDGDREFSLMYFGGKVEVGGEGLVYLAEGVDGDAETVYVGEVTDSLLGRLVLTYFMG